ncbi:MAG: hypothetical protein H0U59_09070, partial [Gemmatimonadaceae bacterium]|nr:hypothetical protein [Gemmatimonadaceae bacterium]
MTAAQKVSRARITLALAAIAQAVAWGAAVTLLLLAVGGFIAKASASALESAAWVEIAAIGAGLAVTSAFLWRARRLRSIHRVALWIEEKVPSLQYSLVTAVEGGQLPDPTGIESTIAREDIGRVVSRALGKALLPAAAAAVIAAALLYVSPSSALGGQGIFSAAGSARSVNALPLG